MPFGPEFEDVYEHIKMAVDLSNVDPRATCFRLDEHRPAGRITNRLISELRDATVCVADLTGARPNVMWELGYAMALNKPALLITQDPSDLAFDVKDMQCIVYERNRLTASLSVPLQRSLVDTVNHLPPPEVSPPLVAPVPTSAEIVAPLMSQIGELRGMIKDLVHLWVPAGKVPSATSEDLGGLVGHWVNGENQSHAYVELVDGQLVAPYCFGGNQSLTGLYHGWRRVGEYWYGQFHWLYSAHAGFTFLRRESESVLTGAWWFEDEGVEGSETPPEVAGVQSRWVRQPAASLPQWASECIEDVRKRGVDAVLQLERRRSW